MIIQTRKQLCSWILAISISLFSFVELGYGEQLEDATRTLTGSAPQGDSGGSSQACLQVADILPKKKSIPAVANIGIVGNIS